MKSSGAILNILPAFGGVAIKFLFVYAKLLRLWNVFSLFIIRIITLFVKSYY